MKTKSEILKECWEVGSDTNKSRLNRYKLIVETYAYNCMEKLEEELKRGLSK